PSLAASGVQPPLPASVRFSASFSAPWLNELAYPMTDLTFEFVAVIVDTTHSPDGRGSLFPEADSVSPSAGTGRSRKSRPGSTAENRCSRWLSTSRCDAVSEAGGPTVGAAGEGVLVAVVDGVPDFSWHSRQAFDRVVLDLGRIVFLGFPAAGCNVPADRQGADESSSRRSPGNPARVAV